MICRNCGNEFSLNYCNRCGEKAYHQDDKKLSHIFEEGFHFLTHFEGKFFNTLRVVFKSPGRLSVDYCNGIKKKYFKPISFFLMLVILYLLFPIFEGLNMQLYYQDDHRVYGSYAQQRIDAVMAAKGYSMEALTDIYRQKSEKTSKFLLFLPIPVLALFSLLLGFKKRKYYFDHFIFSTEIIAFFILWGFLLFPFLLSILNELGMRLIISDANSGLFILGWFLPYLFIASRKFFRFSWWYALIYMLLYTVFFLFFLEVVYKFILFSITMLLV